MYYVYYHNYPCRTPQLHFLRFNQKHEGGGIKDMLFSQCQKHGGTHTPKHPMIYATGGN